MIELLRWLYSESSGQDQLSQQPCGAHHWRLQMLRGNERIDELEESRVCSRLRWRACLGV
jgi:hypothetical protein